jgi:hypothetical protein
MKYPQILSALLLGSLFFACVNGDEDAKAPHAKNVQFYTVYDEVDETSFYPADTECEYTPEPIPYRLEDDVLEMEFGGLVYVDEDVSFPIVERYKKVSGSFPKGVWARIGNRARGSSANLEEHEEEIEAELAYQEFIYKGEVLYIDDSRISFSYPHFFFFPFLVAEYGEIDGTFTYIGKDSLRIDLPGETVGVKYVPYQYLKATSSLDRAPLHFTEDYCTLASDSVANSWLGELLEMDPVVAKRARRAGRASLR